MSDWLVAYTAPNCEPKAVRFGPLFGLVCYCPQTHAAGRRGTRALFPRYLFVANTFAGVAAAVRSAFGFAGLVQLGDRPALMGQGAIDAVKMREVGGIIPLPDSSRQAPVRVLRAGMRIRVNLATGPVDAVFRARQGSKRSVVYIGKSGGERFRAVVENQRIVPV